MNTLITRISIVVATALLAFSALTAKAAPTLRIQHQKGKVTMDWEGKGKLEWASTPEGPWETVGNVASPFSIEQNRARAFFRIRQTDDEVHDAATWLLDLLSPVDEDPKSFDETLLRFISLSVCALEPGGACTNVAVLNAPDLHLDNNFYGVDWNAPANLAGKDLRFRVSVSGLDVGAFDESDFSPGTLPIKFRIDDHPRLRARVLHEQGFSAKDVAAVLAGEFALDATETSRILFWDNYDATGVTIALRDLFHLSAEAAAGILKSMGRNAGEVVAALRGAYALTPQNTAQLLQTLGYPCLEIAVALASSYQLTFADVLPIMRAVGCSPADNCEYPPPPPGGDTNRAVTANLLWFLPTALQPLPPVAGHRDNFDASLLGLLAADIFEVDQSGNRTLITQASIQLHPNFYMFSWKPSQRQQSRNFQVRYSVAGLDLGFTPITPDNPGNLPFKFRIDNHPVIRARVLHHQQNPANSIASALRDEFGLTADELVRILYEETFDPTEIGRALNTTYQSDPIQAAAAFRTAGLSAVIALQMLEGAFGELNVTNNVFTLRSAAFPITEVWRALEIVRGLKDKDIEGILIAGGFPQDEVLATLAPRLLAKYACIIDKSGPIVYLHPAEIYLPSSVDWFLERATLVASNSAFITHAQVTPANLTQTALQIETNQGPTKFWLELPEAYRHGNFESAKSYVHAVRLKDMGMTDLQFWLFRAYNGPGTVKADASIDPIGGVCSGEADAGNVHPLGEHTGDWEAVYLRFDDATGGLVLAFTSQHGSEPVAHPDQLTFEGTHPVFYASLNGHANYIAIGDNTDVAFSACESPFYVAVSTVNRTGHGTQYPIYRAYDFVALDNADLNAPWVNFPGRWGPAAPFNLSNDQKEDILRNVLGNCTDAIRVAIPIACAVVCAPFAALFGVGYLPCFAACTAGGEIILDPMIERFAPKVVDFAFSDQSTDGPTTPGSKTSEWNYFRYPGEKL
ncbi:MAG TPA: Vps62-related protein, partial [Candidatus Binatia bacterium]|nr:Vps62-related protein [Candidatus Binatia bacterium]